MKPFVLLVVSLLSYAAASDTIKPLFETDSIAAYNRWLGEHRDEYLGFRPVLTRADFLTDSAAVLQRPVHQDSSHKREIVARQVYYGYSEDGDHGVVYHPGGLCRYASTAYDRYGRKLFESAGYIHHRFNLWFRDTEASDTIPERHPWLGYTQESESTQVLTDEGTVMAVLPRVSIQAASSSGDTLIAAVSDGGTLVFDRGAHVRWRDSMFGTASRIAAISPDGRKVAVVTRDSVGLHDLVTGRSKVLGIHSATAARYRTNYVVWSNDGRRFAVYRVDWDVPDSALLWVFTRDGKAAAQPRRLEANYGENLFWMGDTVVLVASPYLPDLRKWIHQKPWFVGPCKVTAVTLRGHLQTWMVQGRFGGDDVWYQQGRHLVCVDKSRGYAAVFQVPVQ